jgi:hypothetical protein
MTTAPSYSFITIQSQQTFTSLYTGAQIAKVVTINDGDGVSHTWTETATGFSTTTDLAAEWKADYQAMLSGHASQLTAIQRLEGNAEALLENTGLAKLSLSQQEAFRVDVQREYDAIAAAQQIAQATLGTNPNAPLTVQSYSELASIIQGNPLLEELGVQGHGLNKAKSAAYDGYTLSFQNNTDNVTKFIGGGALNNNQNAIQDFFDDNGLSHLPFGTTTVNGVVYQLNQNGAVENTVVAAVTALNDSLYFRTYTAADFAAQTSTAASNAVTGAQAYSAADAAQEAALQAQSAGVAGAGLTETQNADGGYALATVGAGSYLGVAFASARMNYSSSGAILNASFYDAGGTLQLQVEGNSQYVVYKYVGGTVVGLSYASLASTYTSPGVLASVVYEDANGQAVATKTIQGAGYTVTVNGAVAQVKTVSADGSYDVHTYLNAAGTVGGVAYASTDAFYTSANGLDYTNYLNAGGQAVGVRTATANGGYSLTVNGALAQVKSVNADGSYQLVDYSAGAATSEAGYNSAGSRLWQDAEKSTSSALTLTAANERVTVGPGLLTVASGSDLFTLPGHASETLSGGSLQGETFAFQAHSGAAPWSATLSGLTASDHFQFAASALGAANAAGGWAALLSKAQYAGGSATITDLYGDKVTFSGVNSSALAAMHSQFSFT